VNAIEIGRYKIFAFNFAIMVCYRVRGGVKNWLIESPDSDKSLIKTLKNNKNSLYKILRVKD